MATANVILNARIINSIVSGSAICVSKFEFCVGVKLNNKGEEGPVFASFRCERRVKDAEDCILYLREEGKTWDSNHDDKIKISVPKQGGKLGELSFRTSILPEYTPNGLADLIERLSDKDMLTRLERAALSTPAASTPAKNGKGKTATATV